MDLVYGKEKALFTISIVLSLMFWLVLVVGTLGMVLIWALMFFLMYLFAHSAFISYLKGTAVRVTAQQFPDLYQRIAACAHKLGMQEVPDAYLLHGNGVFNALATRFLGRHFIVLYSDVVDALEDRPEALNFYIGHELGHISRRHLTWAPLLAPAGVLPLLGAAYSRAREYTCDRHGLACCASPQDAAYGLAALAAGGKRWKTLDLNTYAAQSTASSGFWMSLHELIGDYPWLTKRMGALQALAANQSPKHPPRNVFAYLFALLVPRLGVGAGAGVVPILIVVAIIGVLAAIAIPAYQDYMNRAHVVSAVGEAEQAKTAVLQYAVKNRAWPSSNRDAGIDEAGGVGAMKHRVEIRDGGVIAVAWTNPGNARASLTYTPHVKNGQLYWECATEGLSEKQVPPDCR
ncbi:MAG: M48 family metalloprotease [Sulfurifustis sp.]